MANILSPKLTSQGVNPAQVSGYELNNALNALENTSNAIVDVFDNISANGSTSATTTVLNYGVNIITTASGSDYACKLPQPVTGKTCIVVNKSNAYISMFPSNVGGQINNLPVDTPVSITPDGKQNQFICIENPLPGAWTWSAPATSQIQIGEMSVAHVNGVVTNKYGTGTGTETATAGIGVTPPNLVITSGNWKSENIPTTVTILKCYTNILPTDMLSQFLPDAIQTDRLCGFLSAPNSAATVSVDKCFFLGQNCPSYTGGYAPIGTLNAPPLVGDSGTMYMIVAPSTGSIITSQIGTGGTYSRYYYILGMYIPASAITKTYKFQFFLEIM